MRHILLKRNYNAWSKYVASAQIEVIRKIDGMTGYSSI